VKLETIFQLIFAKNDKKKEISVAVHAGIAYLRLLFKNSGTTIADLQSVHDECLSSESCCSGT
jgi:hypothetical protein